MLMKLLGKAKWPWLRLQLWRVEAEIQSENSEAEALLIERWDALEQQDAPAYRQFTDLHHASRRVMRELKTRRDEIASQLERL